MTRSPDAAGRSRWRRVAAFLGVSALAAALATVAGGAVEAVPETSGLLEGLGAIGFLGLVAVPFGFALSLALRLLWRAWRPHDVVARLTDPETGGAPRLAAWVVFLAAASVVLAFAVLQGMNRVVHATRAGVVHILLAPILAVATAAALVAVSGPALRGLTRVAVALDRRAHRRWGRSLFLPRWVAVGAVALAVVLLVLAWVLSIHPQIGAFDLGFLPAVVVWLAVLVLAPAGWAALPRRRWVQAVAAVLIAAGAAGSMGTGLWLRYRRPFTMLEIWGESHLSGLAIDRMWDVQVLRRGMDLHVAPAARPGAAHPDIVLITIDTVRADHTPPYGGSAHMPALQRLAAHGTVFDWAFSPGNVTRRSVPSIAIGVSAPRLRGRVAGWALKLDPRHVLLAERLRAAGYDTAGFFCCGSHFGAQHKLGLIRGIDYIVLDKDGTKLAHAAVKWLDARARHHSKRPVFLWMHLIEPHLWEAKHPPTSQMRAMAPRYDMSLADADRGLGILLDRVWAGNRATHTLVVVTADHGEGLGEHGIRNHSMSMYDSETHVPLVMAGPGVPKRRVARTVGLIGLAPTLLDLAGFVPPGMPWMDGRSFAPWVLGRSDGNTRNDGEAYIAMIRDRSVSHSQRALVEGHFKLIARDGKHTRYELYDLTVDPGEHHNLARNRPALLARLRARLAHRRALDSVNPF